MRRNNMDDRTAELLARDERDVQAALADASPDVQASAPAKPEPVESPDVEAAERDARTGAWAHVEPVGRYTLDPWDVT